MGSTPHPVEHLQILDHEDVPYVRKLHCRKYDECLDVADKKSWPGFSCERCSAYEPQDSFEAKCDEIAIIEHLMVASAEAERRYQIPAPRLNVP